MNARIQGLGWVTPLGRELDAVWAAVRTGAAGAAGALVNPCNDRSFPVFRVDGATVAEVTRLPRLRRSSAISHFAVAAALDALRDGHHAPGTDRLGLVFASSNGGVNYTRRFFEEVSRSGTHAGSPLLFPETVYNAPASHIAALAGITGVATTIVNDATAGVEAIATALELLDSDACDRCLVVAAEEADWVLCEAYAAWRLAGGPGGVIFGEGAAAILLGREGDGPTVEPPRPGATFRSIGEAGRQLAGLAGGDFQIVVSSAAGTRFDAVEAGLAEGALRMAPKAALGEAFAASTLMQVVTAALALRKTETAARALVPVVGYQGQVAALALRT